MRLIIHLPIPLSSSCRTLCLSFTLFIYILFMRLNAACSHSHNSISTNGSVYGYSYVQAAFVSIKISVSTYLKSADDFDNKYINSTSDSWVFDYSRSRCYAHFCQDKISNQLIKYICFRYASAKCPAQVPSVIHAWSS